MELIYFVTAVILAKNNNKKKVLEKDTINTEIWILGHLHGPK